MQKRIREISRSLSSLTPTFKLGQTRGCHIRATVTNKAGETKDFFMSGSPSDWRGDKNKFSDIRRFCGG